MNNITNDKTAYNFALMVYILQALSIVTAIPMVIGLLINYIKLNEVRGTWVESHFRWQIRTFWFFVLWTFIGVLTIIVFFLGYLILGLTWLWVIYRIAKGWFSLSAHKEMYR